MARQAGWYNDAKCPECGRRVMLVGNDEGREVYRTHMGANPTAAHVCPMSGRPESEGRASGPRKGDE